jgi:phosphate transport system substrate-binding protein
MKSLFTVLKIIAVLLVFGVLIACGKPQQEKAAMSPDRLVIHGAGATFPQPLYARWIEAYKKVNSDVDFVYEGVGSGEGIHRFIAETVDFGASDAAMTDDEIAQVERGVRLVPMTAGMVVLAYNIEGVQSNLKLPRDVCVDIFWGKIWRWDDPRIAAANPHLDLPSKLIQVVGRRDSSGTTYAFSNHLAAVNDAWRAGPGVGKLIDWPGGAVTGKGNEGVANKIKISQGSIGYVEYGFAKRLGLPMAILQNKAGEYIAPSPQSGRIALAAGSAQIPDDLRVFISDSDASGAYPIVSYSWLLLYQRYEDRRKADALKKAVTWGLNEGQATAEEMGYIPLPDIIVRRATEVLDRVHN